MKNISVVTAFILAATVSFGAMAANNHTPRPEAGSNIDNTAHQNHLEYSHAFDPENLTAGDLQ